MNHLTRNTLGAALTAAIITSPAAARFGDNFFYGEGPVDVWSNASNWGSGLPDFGDIAYVGFTQEARNSHLQLDMSVLDLYVLTISDGMAVWSNGHRLWGDHCWLDIMGRNVDDDDPQIVWPSRFVLEESGFQVDAYVELVTVYNEGYLALEDGAEMMIELNLYTDAESGAFGEGTWSFLRDDPNLTAINNRGYLSGQPGVAVFDQLGASKFDLDGNNQDETGRVSAAIASGGLGSTVIFNGTALADDFDGDMTINFNGRIEMNMSSNWTLGPDGLLRFGSGNQNETPTLAGSTMTVLGDIDANARNSVIEANVWLQNGSHTTVATNDMLTFTGNTIANSALFTVNDGGTLNFAGPTNATANSFILNGGTMVGANILNEGSVGIRGYGTVENRVINDGMVLADGGTLLVNGTNNDWDGIGNTGNLRSADGVLHLTDNQDFSFSGDMRAFIDDEIFIDGFGMTLTPSSYLYLLQATLRATEPFVVGGDFDSVFNVDMAADVVLASTVQATIGENLNLLQQGTVQPGASITGAAGAKLVGGAEGELDLVDTSVVDVTVSGQGLTRVDQLLGTATVNGDFLLGGTLAMQISAAIPGHYDRLVVADTFEAAGVIDVTSLGYIPVFGDLYDLLDFTTFDDQGYTLLLPALAVDLDWDTTDFETDGILRIGIDTCRADVNDDGFVNFGDILMVIGSWNTPDVTVDVDQSGLVGMSDIFEIIAAWGVCP
ncbi:MAG: autotransporter outer membrane beta-barrel domain-containing protein [Planctomycetota bacterium]|jgi:hypothetical protein